MNLLLRFVNVLGTCGFGIDCNSIEDINSEFYKQGQAIFEHGMPNIKTAESFFKEVVKETLRYREDNKIIRKDFMHLMIQLKNEGVVTELTNENEDMNEKTVSEETLRKYPPVAALPRLCTKTFTIPGTNCIIEKGTAVTIPVLGLQMDPEYWPEPEKFIPERFSSENKSRIKDCTYIPFGEGPRMCLGMRFGLMQSKAGIASLVNKFNFTLDDRTPYPPQYDKHSFLLAVKGGIWLNATKAV